MDAYPPNRRTTSAQPEKKVERVTSVEAKRRKKPLGRQFRETFVGGDARTATQYVIFEVLVPAMKDALAEAGSQGIERLIFGESRRRGAGRPPTGPTGYINYQQQSRGPQQRSISPRARSRHDFDEIVLESRTEAEDVLERLFDLLSKYEAVTVADLYDLTGLPSTHTDHKWGWTELRGTNVRRLGRNGYLLDLPSPEPLR